jgi:hypothetical protein
MPEKIVKIRRTHHPWRFWQIKNTVLIHVQPKTLVFDRYKLHLSKTIPHIPHGGFLLGQQVVIFSGESVASPEVKSYKAGLETTWDVVETDGHLNSMRIVGRYAGEMGGRVENVKEGD